MVDLQTRFYYFVFSSENVTDVYQMRRYDAYQMMTVIHFFYHNL